MIIQEIKQFLYLINLNTATNLQSFTKAFEILSVYLKNLILIFMCGICGVVKLNNEASIDLVYSTKVMTDYLHHRGPDDWGINTNAGTTLIHDKIVQLNADIPSFALGHKRLSIIDLTPLGHQPMSDEENGLTIVFNGEIYNYIELREELKGKYNFKTNTDTEVLLAAYQIFGSQMLRFLDGMFAFAILDIHNRKLFGARDNSGIKPFYYHYSFENGLWFASEPKAICKGLGMKGTPNHSILSEFLVLGVSDHDENTFYDEIRQLPPAHYLELDINSGKCTTHQYWKPPVISEPELGQNLSEQYISILHTAVSRQLRSDVPVGSSLSGGIDSSAIVSTVGELLGQKSSDYKTLTFSFPGFKNDESVLAKQVAAKAGLSWVPVEPTLDTLQTDLEQMVERMTEPFSTLSMFAQYKVMEAAKKQGLIVMLDGQGGDEVYLGYPRVVQRVIFHYLKQGKIGKSVHELIKLHENLSLSYNNMLLGNAYFNSKAIAFTRKKAIFSRYLNTDLIQSVRPDLLDDYFAGKDIYSKQNDELMKYLLPRLLRFADRNSMAFSIEQRVPHLSRLILDFNLSLPVEYRIQDGWSKYIVRKSLEGRIPNEILWSKVKRGFDIPQSYWVEQLSDYLVERVASNDEISTLFNKKSILQDLKTPSKQGSYYLWRAVSAILWIDNL
ncbi:asparagine synthase (glutamine-hydrolyzing) [Fulvivirga lutea]|uniref:asparagine synthase (glutamine-hydrolyzing) n=1 Tax=Fulvivirga lutea TaxID=2810512 RepID=A0A974WFI7_9BACT|nr:asparagine synthase (glutamine-hydrolyzing) [Fulvivirga lutea]QSE96799.1 asparagine synthase (glutamine-hydrolyzing) [Fulvivirga lutea]